MKSIATLGGGCFWCLEAVFQEVKGVNSVISGYMGGKIKNPSYEDIHNGSGDAEVVQITFDPSVISYEELLRVYFYVHDPTQLNRQGPDEGEEYRSAIFYHDEEQKRIANKVIKDFVPTLWDGKIVTELLPASEFWQAEDYHQNFYQNNQSAGYCQVIINPKLKKFRKKFTTLLK